MSKGSNSISKPKGFERECEKVVYKLGLNHECVKQVRG